MGFRRRARPYRLAVANLLLAAFCSGPLVFPHIDPLADALCNAPLAVEHDHAAHRFESGEAGETHAPHCLLCHLVRASGAPAASIEHVQNHAVRTARPWDRSGQPTSTERWSVRPVRAPPA
jgi:hypothetical protein